MNQALDAQNPDEQDAVDMARLATGHDPSLNELMDRHAEKVFHYLLHSLQNESDAADLAQETFVKVYQNRAKFDARQKFSTWLYAIASNLVRTRYRWRVRHAQVSLNAENPETGTELGEQLADATSTPSESLEFSERSEKIRSAIAALPNDFRLPLVLAEYEDKSHAEIAAILNCSVKAVENRICQARNRLRAALVPVLQMRDPRDRRTAETPN
jgi:RNA polymerase sigma-70 factor, ECF subfamily